MNDPIEHAFESKQFEVKRHVVARSFGKACLMNPNPHIAEDQRHGHKEQPQVRIARAGVDAGLPHLAITGFDAEPFAITFADFGGRAAHAPGGEKQLLTFLFAVFAVPITAIAHADRESSLACLPFFMVCEYQPAGCRLIQCRPVGFARFLGRRPENITGIRNGRFSCCKNVDHRAR